MKILAVSVCTVLALVAPAAAAGSASRALVIGDPVGDANFINDGGEFGFGDRPSDTSDDSLDLLRVELSRTTSGRATTGFRLSMTLAAPLRDRAQLTLKARTENCPDILITYVHRARAEPQAVLSTGCSSAPVTMDAQVVGNTYSVLVPLQALPLAARRDRLLQTVNAFSQIHLGNEPVRDWSIGTSMVDTTLDRVTYKLS